MRGPCSFTWTHCHRPRNRKECNAVHSADEFQDWCQRVRQQKRQNTGGVAMPVAEADAEFFTDLNGFLDLKDPGLGTMKPEAFADPFSL